MREIIMNGKKIRTNIDTKGEYPFSHGDSKTMALIIKPDFRMEDQEFLEYCVNKGYTTISFKRATTSVRGYYNVFALCK